MKPPKLTTLTGYGILKKNESIVMGYSNEKIGILFLIVGAAAAGLGIYGFIKVGSEAELFDLITQGLKEFGVKVSGLDVFAMTNRVWLTIAGGVAALAGCVMTFRKDS